MKIKLFVIMLVLISASLFAEGADVLFDKGRYEEAVIECKKEIAVESNVVSYYVMGWSLMRLGKYEEVITEMLKAIDRHGRHRKVILNIAKAYYKTGEYEKAEQYYKEYIKNNPSGESIATVYYYLGEIFLVYKEYQHADIAFSTAVYIDKNKSHWLARLGYSRQQSGDYASAIEAYSRALKLDPGSQEALKGKKECEALLGA